MGSWRDRLRGPLAIAWGLTACASSKGASGTGPVVTDIEIRGARAVSERELKKRLATQEPAWWPFARKHGFDPIEWQVDLERIVRYYETQGYYAAKIASSRVIDRGKGQIALLVEVREEQPVRIGSVTVRGLEPLAAKQRKDILDGLPLEAPEVFREQQWQEAKRRVVERLKEGGHAAAALVGEAKLDLQANRGALDLLVDPGRHYRFGEVRVSTPQGSRVGPELVREQVELALGTDRRYSDVKLREAQQRVLGMGIFATARIAAGEPDPATGLVPVEVEVREAPFHSIRLGGGVAIDQVRQEGRVLGAWADRNFLGGLRQLELDSYLGWAFIPSALSVIGDRQNVQLRDGPVFRATAELEQPRFLSRPSLRLSSLLEIERTIEPAYDALGGRGRLAFTWQPRTRIVLQGSYNLQGYHLNGSPELTPTTAPLVLGCTTDPCFVLVSYLEQVATWDRRDHPLEPRRGFYLSLSLQEGGGPLGGTFDYVRVSPEARVYVSPARERVFTVAARLRLGTLAPSSGQAEDSPAVSRFYAGGPNSMRGFALRRLSPMVLVVVNPARPEVQAPLPIGGNGLIEGSVELRARVGGWDSLLLATFVDFGSVTAERLPLQDPGRLLWAAGLGLRYLSPIGPIRLDLGIRLPFGRPPPLYDGNGTEITYRRGPGGTTEPGQEDGSNVQESCFGIGEPAGSSWVTSDLCSLHISIGEAF